MRFDIGTELIYVTLVHSEILENTRFEAIQIITEAEKAKKKEEEERKEYL